MNVDSPVGPDQGALIAGLATPFGIEGRHIEYDFDFITLARLFDERVAFQDGLNNALGVQLFITDEGGALHAGTTSLSVGRSVSVSNPPVFLARVRCSSMAASKPVSSSLISCSRQASTMRSIGNP